MTTATALGNAINSIVFPLILISAIVSIINHMSASIKLQRLGKFFTQIAQVALGFFLTLFVGMVTMRALYAAVLDKTALRATRFVSDNALPVIGKMFSDTIEVVAGYVVMLKQALGVLGVLIILAMILMPIVKVTAIALIYKVAAALAEPLGDARTAAVLESMSAHLFLMLAAVVAVALMFFVMIAIVAGLSNGWGGMH
jgi:stage III sporulation protein AE